MRSASKKTREVVTPGQVVRGLTTTATKGGIVPLASRKRSTSKKSGGGASAVAVMTMRVSEKSMLRNPDPGAGQPKFVSSTPDPTTAFTGPIASVLSGAVP